MLKLFLVLLLCVSTVSAQLSCEITDVVGCYTDFLDGKTRTLPVQASTATQLTQEVKRPLQPYIDVFDLYFVITGMCSHVQRNI